MLKVVFFARVREELDCAALELEFGSTVTTLAALKEQLCQREGGRWRAVLSQDNIICAVNHTVAGDDTLLGDNDEVAFYPPVTGG